jgi:TrmH family RNA methyltransferase
MTRIASPHNPRLKALGRLRSGRERARSGSFIAEGEDLVLAAHAAGREPLEGYVVAGEPAPGAPAAHAEALRAATAGFQQVERAALARLSALGSGTRVLAVYRQRWSEPAGPLCVYLHGVADPGNVGTILRAAHAFGASSVALGPGCADPHGAKAVRASMGAIFSVALARVQDIGALPGELLALSTDAREPLRGPREELAAELTLLVGAERGGLPPEVLERCPRRARIEIAGDSLNAAMAAAIALYEMTRPSRVRPS